MSILNNAIMRTTVYERMETLKVVFKCVWEHTNADGKFVAACVPCQHEKSICSKVRKLIDSDLNRVRKKVTNSLERIDQRIRKGERIINL